MPAKPLIIHDSFSFTGGGEKVAMSLAKTFNGEVITGHIDSSVIPDNYFKNIPVQNLHGYENGSVLFKLSKTYQLWNTFSNIAKASPPWTIFSGTISLLGHKKIKGPKILYCHTPPRLLYDQKRYYYKKSSPLKYILLFFFIPIYKMAYKKAIGDMDLIIANSKNIKNRLKKYLDIDSTIVYPPCDTVDFSYLGQEDYYLSTARLDNLKRVDLIVDAFSKMPDKKLIIVSGGPEEKTIRKAAGNSKNIIFTGYVDDEKLRELTGKCIATIYIPRDEDFGISPVESMAAGKPVIGVKEGGLLETVINNKTGILIPADPDYTDIIDAVKALSPQRALEMREECEKRAPLFSENEFIKNMAKSIDSITKNQKTNDEAIAQNNKTPFFLKTGT